MIWLIELLVLSMTCLLMYHAQRREHTEFVKLFWISGLSMGFLREASLVGISDLYSYGDFHLTLFGVPLIYGVIWTNFSYVSWQWSENYLGRKYLGASAWDHHLPLMFITMVFIAFFFEVLLSQAQLIHWNLDASKTLWGGVPILTPFAYGFTAVLFMITLRWIVAKPTGNWQVSTLKLSALQPLSILVLTALLFLTNLAAIIVFAD